MTIHTFDDGNGRIARAVADMQLATITKWLAWFLDCLDSAITNTDTVLESVLYKSRFWDRHRDRALNQRQVLMLSKLVDEFDGKLTSPNGRKLPGSYRQRTFSKRRERRAKYE